MQKINTRKRNLGVGVSAVLLAGMMLAACPAYAEEADKTTTATAAARGIEMSTDYPGITVKAGESINFGLDFLTLDGTGYDVALSIEEIPDGWEGYFKSSSSQISKVHINEASNGSSSSLATFVLSLPDEVEEGTYTVVLGADAGNGITAETALEVTVNPVAVGQGTFTTEYPEQQGATGTSFSFDATIVNNRGIEQSYSLSAQAPTGWEVSFTPSGESTQVASMTVDPESSKGMTIAVVPPESVEKGEYTIACTAISANETLNLDLNVEITGTYKVTLSTSDGRLSFDAHANDQAAVTLTVTNDGNVDLENLNLTSSAPSSWEVSFSESTIDLLEAGATKEVTAYVTPAKDSITGDYVASLKVSNSEASSGADFRVSVKTRTSWGFAAVAIIVVLVICLGAIFKKFGRR